MIISYISTYPPTRCGIGAYTNYLSRALLKVDEEVKVAVIAERGAAKVEEPRLRALPCFDRREDYPPRVLEALDQMDHNLRVVHIQHEFAIFNPDERFLALLEGLKLAERKVVVTLHTVHTNETSDWEGMAMSMEDYNRRVGELADAVVVHQRSQREALLRQGLSEEAVHLIPHGTELLERQVPQLQGKEEARAALGLPQEGRIILSFGFLGGRYKNKGVLIEALARLLDRIPDVHLFFSGYPREGSLEDLESKRQLEERARQLGLEGRVHFAERFIPDEEVHLVFGASDVAVFPYLQSFFSASGALHLAMGAGLPVVVSRIPKFEEVSQEISPEVTFDPHDPEELAKVLMRLLGDGDFERKILERVRAYALRTSWEEVARAHMRLYRALVG